MSKFVLVYAKDDAQNRRLGDWMRQHMQIASTSYWTAGLLRDGELIGAVIYHNYRHPSIEMGLFCTDPRWVLNRVNMFHAFAYPFDQLKCERITAQVSDNKPRLQTLLEHMGFEREGTIRHGESDGSSIGLYGLLKREFTWPTLLHAPSINGMMLSVATH